MSLKSGVKVKVAAPTVAMEEYRGRCGEVKGEADNSTPQCRRFKVLLEGKDHPIIFRNSELAAIPKPVGRPPKTPEPALFSPGEPVAVRFAEGGLNGCSEAGSIVTGEVKDGRVQVKTRDGKPWVPVDRVTPIAAPEPAAKEEDASQPQVLEPCPALPEPPDIEALQDAAEAEEPTDIERALQWAQEKGIPFHVRTRTPEQLAVVKHINDVILPRAPEEDAVRPSHYKIPGTDLEVIDVLEALGFAEDAYLFQALTYILRHKRKNGREDLEKGLFYLTRRIEMMKRAEEASECSTS